MITKYSLPAIIFSVLSQLISAQDVHLHVNPQWEECSFQLDPSLTQQEFSEFTREAGLVAAFRPLNSASPLGAGRFEISLVQWKTTIDETKGAWNNTFVHPHDEHYLIGGDALPFPGLTTRIGITDKLDAGTYWTMRPGANYGFLGAQVQYSVLNAEQHKVDCSSRLGFNSLYGPKDVNFAVYSLDVLVSRQFTVYKNLLSLSPYVGTSIYLAHSREKSDVVDLKNENALGPQFLIGAVANIWNFRFAAEYNFANVNTVSIRLGYNFKMWTPTKK